MQGDVAGDLLPIKETRQELLRIQEPQSASTVRTNSSAAGRPRRPNVHDSQVFDELIDPSNSCAAIWAASAYPLGQQQQAFTLPGYRSHIHRMEQTGKPLSERAQEANRKRSKVHARVEHIFGQQVAMDGKRVRTTGLIFDPGASRSG